MGAPAQVNNILQLPNILDNVIQFDDQNPSESSSSSQEDDDDEEELREADASHPN